MKIIQIKSNRQELILNLINLRYLILDLKFSKFLKELYDTTPNTTNSPDIELYHLNTNNSIHKLSNVSDQDLAEKIADYHRLAGTLEAMGEVVRREGDTIDSMLNYKNTVAKESIFAADPIYGSFDLRLAGVLFTVIINIRGGVRLLDSAGNARCKSEHRGNTCYKINGRRFIISTFMAAHWLGKCPSGYHVGFIDGNKSNLSKYNIKYMPAKRATNKTRRAQ